MAARSAINLGVRINRRRVFYAEHIRRLTAVNGAIVTVQHCNPARANMKLHLDTWLKYAYGIGVNGAFYVSGRYAVGRTQTDASCLVVRGTNSRAEAAHGWRARSSFVERARRTEGTTVQGIALSKRKRPQEKALTDKRAAPVLSTPTRR
jgi:hypothetical protein